MATPEEQIQAFDGQILIVDDLANWREVLSEILAADGHTIFVAKEPEGAVKIMSEQPIDVAILDLRLEDKDFYNVQGIQLLRHLRRISPRIRVLMMTGFPSAKLLNKVLTIYEVDGFWLKNPSDGQFDIPGFKQEVRLLVARSRQRRN